MGKGISIGVASDTKEFSSGIKTGVIKPLENASDALDDVARDGDKAGDKLEKAMEGARKETSDFKKEQSDLGRAMATSSKEGSQALKKNTSDGARSASADLRELGDEAKANASETFSSFDGSASSFADGIQGTLGGVVSSLGPLGAAAGAAGAAGIGLMIAAGERGVEATEAYKTAVSELAQEYIDTGGKGETSLDYLVDKLKTLATETDDGAQSLAKIKDLADDSARPFERLAQAFAGNSDELQDQIDLHREAADSIDKNARSWGFLGDDATKSAAAQSIASGKIADSLEDVQKGVEDAAEAEALWLASGGPEMAQKAAGVESIQDSVDDAAGSWDDYQDSETQAIDPGAYLAALAARLEAGNSYAANMADIQNKLSPEAYQYLVDQGIDFAPMLGSIIEGGPAMVAQFDTAFTQAATAGNAAMDGTLEVDKQVSVTLNPDVAKAEQRIAETEGRKRNAEIDVDAKTRNAEKRLDDTAKRRISTITAEADTLAAERALERFANRSRNVKITATVVDKSGRLVI